MRVSIRSVCTPRDRDAVYRFWYDVYVREMNRSVVDVDHDRMMLIDDLEAHSIIHAAYYGNDIVGTVRLNFPCDGPVSYYEDLYQIPFCHRGSDRVVLVTRLMVHSRFRSSLLGFRLSQEALISSLRRGTHYGYIDCNAHLVSYFSSLGFVVHLGETIHPEFGQVHIMSYDLSNPLELPGLLGNSRRVVNREQSAVSSTIAQTRKESTHMTRIVHKGIFDPEIYKQRVNRSEVFLGRTPEEQQHSQQILANSVVGIAGAGGIGGAMALRLARLGVRNIKIADPQTFDWTNVNRQFGAAKATIGRNKAEVVGELVNELAGDVNIEVFSDGITTANANEFVQGCDLILDQLEFFVLAEKYALHRAFRSHEKTKCILACSVVGWAAHLYKFERNGMPIEQWYGIPEASTLSSLSENDFERIIKIWAPKLPVFPSYREVREWMKKNNAVPIFAGAPPLAEGVLTQRATLALIGLEKPPYAAWLPPIPAMYCYDALTFQGELVKSDGTQLNERSIEMLWQEFEHDQVAVRYIPCQTLL